MADATQQAPGQGASEIIAQLQNIARQLSIWSQSITNSTPAATTTTSPKFTGVSLTTTASIVISTSAIRHGLMMHNPGTSSIYVYATSIQTAPSTTNLAGTIVIYAGATLTLPSSEFPNINAGFSAFNLVGSAQPFTIVEWF